MSVVLHLSDTHFGTEQPPVLEALVTMALELEPDLVVFSGDITQRAGRKQFAAARHFVDRLRAPALVLPGNHDIPLFNLWARVLHPYAGYASQFGADLDPTWESQDFLVIGIKTTRRYRHKHGEVSAEQTAGVVRRLRSATARQLRIIVTHQPVHVIGTHDEANLLRGAGAAVAAWAAAGADLVLGGHIHLPFAVPLSERYPDLGRPMWIAQAGTAVSARVRQEAPNSVNVIRYDGAKSKTAYRIERWNYARTSASSGGGVFACVAVSEVTRSPVA